MSAFDQVIGYESIKEEMMQVCDMIRNPETYRRVGAVLPRGMLLYGAPGLGKTLMAKAFIQESGLASFTVRKRQGKENLLAEIAESFRKAKEQAPAIVFLDDMDKFANEDFMHRDAEEYVAIQAAIDEVKDKDVFVLATANDYEKLPDSLCRRGRFDRQIEFNSPNMADAEKIVNYYLKGKKVDPSVNLEDLTKMLDCGSCTMLETVLNEAAIYAAYARRETISMPDLVRAVLREAYESPETFRKMTEEETRRTAVHEAGHAVVCEVLIPGSVGLVSVRAQGYRTGGIMHRCTDIIDAEQDVLVSLAGKAAVELVCPDRFAEGCTSDIERCIGKLKRIMTKEAAYGFGLIPIPPLSGILTSKIEAEIQAELERYLHKAREILLLNRPFLEKLTDELTEKETLLYSDVQRIKALCKK